MRQRGEVPCEASRGLCRPTGHALGTSPAGRPRTARTGEGARRRQGPDRGSVSVEFLGFLPLLLLLALGAVHLGLAAFAAQQAGTGARAAARTATLDLPETGPAAAGRAAMTGWVAGRAAVDAPACAAAGGSVTATVTVSVPALIPGTGFDVTRRATMACPSARSAP